MVLENERKNMGMLMGLMAQMNWKIIHMNSFME